MVMPEDKWVFIRPGSTTVIQVHLHPLGAPLKAGKYLLMHSLYLKTWYVT
jgi:hypothetical protein